MLVERMPAQKTNYVLLMQVRESLTARASEFNIVLDDVAITHLSFGTEVQYDLL